MPFLRVGGGGEEIVVYIVVSFRVGHLYVGSWQVRTGGQSRVILNKMDKGLMVKMFAIVSCVWPESDQESLMLFSSWNTLVNLSTPQSSGVVLQGTHMCTHVPYKWSCRRCL